MLAKWILLGLIAVTCFGWFADHSRLTNDLTANIENRSLHPPDVRLRSFNHVSSNLIDLRVELTRPMSFAEGPERLVAYKILKSWEHWETTNNKRYVAFASTALGVLDCRTAQEFHDAHLVISENVCLDFSAEETESLNRFVNLALNHEN